MTRRFVVAIFVFGVFAVGCGSQRASNHTAQPVMVRVQRTPEPTVLAEPTKCDSSVDRFRACLPDGTEVKLGAPIGPILSEFRCYGSVPQACAYPKDSQELTVFQDESGTIIGMVGAGEGAHPDYGFYGDLQLGMLMELERQHTGAQSTSEYRSTDGAGATADKLAFGDKVVYYVADGCDTLKLYGIAQAFGAEGVKAVEGALSGGCGQM